MQKPPPLRTFASRSAHNGLSQFKYEVFLQGSYKNDTNLGGDSDVDVDKRVSQRYAEQLGSYNDVKDRYAGGQDAFDRFVEEYVNTSP